ncbi:MAG: nucleotidyltransferase domain-containing protein [Candidatus Thorarchaeota archaeon]|nr:nucleotidyltransferase domain-containing protein [Candidatus Thorarchaeota archaeon]
MLEHNEIAQRVLGVAPDDINLIVIFGSRARGDHSEQSDLDIAIGTSLQDKEQRFNLRLQVISLLEGPKQPIDVVILEDSNWTLRHRIARDGVVIFQKNEDTWANFVEQVLIYYPDHRIFEQRFLKDTLGGS